MCFRGEVQPPFGENAEHDNGSITAILSSSIYKRAACPWPLIFLHSFANKMVQLSAYK